MNLLTHLVQTEYDGILAVHEDDPRASELDVVDVAPPGRHYLLAPRTAQEMDRDPKARRCVQHDVPPNMDRRTA